MLVYQRVVHRYLITPLSIFDEGYIKTVTFSEILKWKTHDFKHDGKYREASFIPSSHVQLCRKVLGWQVKTTLVEVALVSTAHPKSILDPQELPSQKEICLSTITFCYVKLQGCKHWHWNAGYTIKKRSQRSGFPCWLHPEINPKHRSVVFVKILRQANGMEPSHKKTKLKKFNYFLLNILDIWLLSL